MSVNWNTIETCPSDTPVLVVESGVTQNMVVMHYDDGSWFMFIDGDYEPLEDFYPSHWMPFPKPPED